MVEVNKDVDIFFSSVLFVGRSFNEYIQMFNLDLDKLQGKNLLDCPAGPASFAADARQNGIEVIACDPLYDADYDSIIKATEAEVTEAFAKIEKVPHLFSWQRDEHKEEFLAEKKTARKRFSEDYELGRAEGRYLKAELPALPFADKSFDMALSGNFLFLYSNLESGGILKDSPFDYDFHLNSLLELCRVSAEVRIYPIKGPNVEQHSFIVPIMQDLRNRGLAAAIVDVPYIDIQGASQMLKLSCLRENGD